jgi:hypothetical protein
MIYTFQHGSVQLGWYYYREALKLRAVPTLFQKATIILALRTVLGQRGYRAFEQIQARFSKQTRERLRMEALQAGAKK